MSAGGKREQLRGRKRGIHVVTWKRSAQIVFYSLHRRRCAFYTIRKHCMKCGSFHTLPADLRHCIDCLGIIVKSRIFYFASNIYNTVHRVFERMIHGILYWLPNTEWYPFLTNCCRKWKMDISFKYIWLMCCKYINYVANRLCVEMIMQSVIRVYNIS